MINLIQLIVLFDFLEQWLEVIVKLILWDIFGWWFKLISSIIFHVKDSRIFLVATLNCSVELLTRVNTIKKTCDIFFGKEFSCINIRININKGLLWLSFSTDNIRLLGYMLSKDVNIFCVANLFNFLYFLAEVVDWGD